MTENKVGTVLSEHGAPGRSPGALQGSYPVFPKAKGSGEHSRCQSGRAQAHWPLPGEGGSGGGGRAEGDGTARRPPGSGNPGRCRGALGPARAPRGGNLRLPVPVTPRSGFPRCPAPPHKAKEKGRTRRSPPPSSSPIGCCAVHPESIFDGEGVPPTLPQISFATSSQPVGPKSAGQKRLGASELGPTVPGAPAPA